jgi:copper oxidase (laccase) domain-containing protein
MVGLGADRARLAAVVGPCIGWQNYEVGHDFMARFLAATDANREFFSLEGGAKPRFALAAFVGSRLRAAGVGRVEVLGACTYADPARFFSYRRTTHLAEPDYGRQISAIMLRA